MKSLKSYFYGAAGAVGLMDLNAELCLEAWDGHTGTVKALLDAGADVHAWDDAALCWAAENGHEETVKLLKEWMARGQGSADHESDQGPGPSITPPGP